MLKQKLSGLPAPPGQPAPYKAADPDKEKINKQVDAYLKQKDEKKKQEDKAKADKLDAEGDVVGSDLTLKPRWRSDYGLWFETPNKDVQAHMGAFIQYDNGWFTQTPSSKATNQLGDLEDGTVLPPHPPVVGRPGVRVHRVEFHPRAGAGRRAIGQNNGTTIQGNGQGLINLDELWAGAYGIPIIGRIRMGHLKVPQGLEGNQMSSSRAMTFLENASYTEAFYNTFGTGVQIANTALDERVFWQAMAYRNDFRLGGSLGGGRGNTGAEFGDGDYCFTGRLGGLLIDECEDRHIFSVAASATWRRSRRPTSATVPPPPARSARA